MYAFSKKKDNYSSFTLTAGPLSIIVNTAGIFLKTTDDENYDEARRGGRLRGFKGPVIDHGVSISDWKHAPLTNIVKGDLTFAWDSFIWPSPRFHGVRV